MAYIRCTDEIHERFKVAAAKAQRTMQDLATETLLPVIEAIESGNRRILSSTAHIEDVPDVPDTMPDLKLESIHGTNPTEKEMPWLLKALKVLRSKKPGLPAALKSNLIQFEDAADEWDARQSRNTSRTHRAGKSATPGRDRAADAPVGPRATGADALFARVDETLDEIESAQKESKTGTRRTPA